MSAKTPVVKKVAVAAPKVAKKTPSARYVIDCSIPIADRIFSIADYEQFLKDRIKVNGKAGNLGKSVMVKHQKKKVIVRSTAGFSKQYLKYLTKKFLKKNQIRDWLRVIATGKNSYQLRYFNIQEAAPEEDEE